MNLGNILQFHIAHNETIFAVTLGLILLTSGYLIYRSVFRKDEALGEASSADITRIEESLKKILSQTTVIGGVPAAGENTGAAGGAGPTSMAGVGQAGSASGGAADPQLKQELETRSKQIEELKKQIEAVKGQDNTPELLAKIKSLEDRLSEYEIIEDDIADLSLYKEENSRLKKEIDSLKGVPAGPTVVNANQATLVEEFDAAVQNLEKQKGPAAPASPAAPTTAVAAPAMEPMPAPSTPAPPMPAEVSVGEDALESAMADASATTPAPVAPAPPAVPAGPPTPEAEPKADIFAEMQGEPQGQDLLAELGDIDADRMLEEIKDLGEGMGDAGVLDEALDMDKMANETGSKKG